MTGLTVHLHAWPTGFYLGLICRQVISVTAGSIMPQCTQRSDRLGRPRSPISGCPTARKQRQCNATGELSNTKEARGVAPPTPPHKGEAQRQQIQNSTAATALHREQSKMCRKMCCAKADEGRGRPPPLKCAAKLSHWKPDKIFQTRPGMMWPIRAGPHELHENR